LTSVAWLLFDVSADSRGDATGSDTAGDGLGSDAWYSVVQPIEDDGVALVEDDGAALVEDDGTALVEDDGVDENHRVAFAAVDLFSVEEGLCTANAPPRSSVQLDEDGDSLDTLDLWYATLGDGMGLADGDVCNKGCLS
jgi:hypothetical protein